MSRKETFPIPSYIILLTLKFSNIFAHNIPNIILRHYALLTYTQVNIYFFFFTSLSNSKIYYFWWYFKIKLTLLYFCYLDITQLVENLPAIQETWVWFLGWQDPLEKEIATHSSILAWRIPWTEEPDWLQTMRSQESDTT